MVMNAFDASKSGDTISIKVTVEPDAHPVNNDQVVQISIEDNGCGIPEEDAARIFDPFYTTKRRGTASGLGLAMVSKIVRNHGGQIHIDSTKGEGTRAVLVWPLESVGEENR